MTNQAKTNNLNSLIVWHLIEPIANRLCTIWLSIVIIFQIDQEVYGSLKEMNLGLIMLTWLLVILSHLNVNQLFQGNLELKWTENFILSSAVNSSKFKITDAKLHVPIVTLFTKDNVNMAKQLTDAFKRSVFWNSYQAIPAKVIKKGKNIYELPSVLFQDVKGLFVLAYLIAGRVAPEAAEAAQKTIEGVFSQEDKMKIITYWLMEGIFMNNQLMI